MFFCFVILLSFFGIYWDFNQNKENMTQNLFNTIKSKMQSYKIIFCSLKQNRSTADSTCYQKVVRESTEPAE